jgi:DNA-directed RNA polymerase alpha subunit
MLAHAFYYLVMKKEHPILHKNIEEVPVSNEFLLMAKQNNFQSLYDITQVTVADLMKKPGMNYRMLAELGQVLNGYGLIDLMEED